MDALIAAGMEAPRARQFELQSPRRSRSLYLRRPAIEFDRHAVRCADAIDRPANPRLVYRRLDIHVEIEDVQRIGHTVMDQRATRRSCHSEGLAVRTEDDLSFDVAGRSEWRSDGKERVSEFDTGWDYAT